MDIDIQLSEASSSRETREADTLNLYIKLYKASLSGDADALNQLIGEDPSSLEKVRQGYSYQTSLHIAASLGHLGITEALLNQDIQLASKSDSCCRLPLHLASEKGHVEIVEKLLEVDAHDAILNHQDKDGRIPLHLAVMQGHLKVMLTLIEAKPESIKERVRGTSESVLHLCVEYNRLEALILLLDLTPRDYELEKCKDDEGNTVLHVGAALNRTEIIKCLTVVPAVREIFSYKNKNGLTALDVSEEFAVENSDSKQIQKILRTNGVPNAPKLPKLFFPINDEWLKEFRGHLITTMALITTVTFQAGIAPPGGVWQDNNKSIGSPNSHDAPAPSAGDVYHEPGTSIIASTYSVYHRQFVFFNTVSFATSVLVIFLLLSGISFKNKANMAFMNLAVFVSIISMTVSYNTSIDMMSPKTETDRKLLMRIAYVPVLIFFLVFGSTAFSQLLTTLLFFIFTDLTRLIKDLAQLILT